MLFVLRFPPDRFGVFLLLKPGPPSLLKTLHLMTRNVLHSTTDTFNDFPYVRPDMAEVSAAFENFLFKFENAKDVQAQQEALAGIVAVREEFSSMFNLCYVRHTANTADPFYEAENQYFDEQSPSFEALNNRFSQALLASPFRDQLAQIYGSHLFTLSEVSLKTFQPSILDDLRQENALSTEYTKESPRQG